MGYSSFADATGHVRHDPCVELETTILDQTEQRMTQWRRVEVACAKGGFDVTWTRMSGG